MEEKLEEVVEEATQEIPPPLLLAELFEITTFVSVRLEVSQ